jgi:hypothetical protein
VLSGGAIVSNRGISLVVLLLCFSRILVDVYKVVPMMPVVPISSVVMPEAVTMRTPIWMIPIVILIILLAIIPVLIPMIVTVIVPVRFSEFARLGRCLLGYSDCYPEQRQG